MKCDLLRRKRKSRRINIFKKPRKRLFQITGDIEDNTAGIDSILSDDGLIGTFFDATDKMFFGCLPCVKERMALIATICDSGFTLVNNPVNKWAFTFFASGQINFSWYASVEIEPYVGFGFF